VIDDNYFSPPRQLQFPTDLFHCSDSFLDRFTSEIQSWRQLRSVIRYLLARHF
jgi:hypothetical protein